MKFARGLVVGKFAPLHKGHELLLQAAASQCGELYIISYSKPEFPGCEPERRARWLREIAPEARSLVVTPELVAGWQQAALRLPPMPANDADATTQRRFTAMLCSEVLGITVDAVFTGEGYGDGFAAALAQHFSHPVAHVMIDRVKQAVPISGTQIRADVHGQRHHLSAAVYADFVSRITFLGGESSGKTTICTALAQEYGAPWVPEYGRTLWIEKSGALTFEDYVHIARTQLEQEAAACRIAQRYVFCDTTPLTTLLYCLDQFGRADPELEAFATTPYDKIYLCQPDFPMVQDGSRRDEAFRHAQYDWYLERLRSMGMDFELLAGNQMERLAKVRHWIEQSR
jgi:NadR type nicotinamide-nucleotide adenylyltransferase